MKVIEIAFTGYPVSDMKRARAFYEGVLGLKPAMDHQDEKSGMAWVEYEIGSGTLALSNSWKPSGQPGPGIAFEVENFDEAVAKVRASGAVFEYEPFESPVCHMAIVKDPEGNSVVIHKRKPGHH